MAHPQNPGARTHDCEGKQRAYVDQFREPRNGQKCWQYGDHYTNRNGRNPRCAKLRMDRRGPFGQQAVTGHREENTRLAKQHDQHHGPQPEHRTDLHEQRAPTHAGHINAQRHRRGHIQRLVVHKARQHRRNHDVEDGADHQRTEDAEGHIPLRILCLLGSGRHSIKADVCKENRARAPGNATPSKVAVSISRRNKRMPVEPRQFRMLDQEKGSEN